MHTIRIFSGGGVRAVYSDDFSTRKVFPTIIPHRASRIEVIEVGPNRGLFGVDFGPLADITGDERYRDIWLGPFEKYDDARRAEVSWLEENYVLAQ